MNAREVLSLLQRPKPTLRPWRRDVTRHRTVADVREAARRRLPRAVFDLIEGGAEDEITLRRNRTALEDVDLVPRGLQDVGQVNLATEVVGTPMALPLVLAPTGFTRISRDGGELDAARAAHACGIPYTAPTMGTTSIEDIADAGRDGDLWFQLYVWRDRGLCHELIERARVGGYRALVITIDTPVSGARERDLRNGMTLPPSSLSAKAILDGMRHPLWTTRFLRAPALTLANFTDRGIAPRSIMELAAEQFDPSVGWDDLAEFAAAWPGPLVIKGVMSVEAARCAADSGAAAVIVSNHGGRQLDGAAAAIEVLPDIVDAVGDRLEVLMDSGIRRGADVVRALSLGAKACLIGRPYLYGLAEAGQPGIEHVIRILEAEMRRTMQLLGAASVAELGRGYVAPRWSRTSAPMLDIPRVAP